MNRSQKGLLFIDVYFRADTTRADQKSQNCAFHVVFFTTLDQTTPITNDERKKRKKIFFHFENEEISGCGVKCRKRGLLYVLQQWPVFPSLVRVRSKMLELKIYNKYLKKKERRRGN